MPSHYAFDLFDRMFSTKRTGGGLILIAMVVLSSALAGGAQELAPQNIAVGVQRTGQMGVRETTAQIHARDRLMATQPRTGHLMPLGRMPGSPAGPSPVSISTATPAVRGPLTAQTLDLNFTGANFNDCSGWPPDTMGAIGPTQFIIVLNGRIRSLSKTNGLADGAINANTDSFFSSVTTPGANFTTDPRIRYDRLSGRWFITMIDVPGQQGKLPNRVMVAMSDSGVITPSTIWTFFQFAGDASNFADYPTLGIDANALYIGVNIFSTSTGSFVNTTGFVVRKSSLLTGGPIVGTPFSRFLPRPPSKSHPPPPPPA